jgi:hypothetical protein
LNNSLISNSNLNTNSSPNNGINNNIYENILEKNNKSFTSSSCPELFKLYNRNENQDFQLQKGFKDVENIYRSCCLNNIKDKWKISLQCNYYCNINQNDLLNDIYEEYDGEHLGI